MPLEKLNTLQALEFIDNKNIDNVYDKDLHKQVVERTNHLPHTEADRLIQLGYIIRTLNILPAEGVGHKIYKADAYAAHIGTYLYPNWELDAYCISGACSIEINLFLTRDLKITMPNKAQTPMGALKIIKQMLSTKDNLLKRNIRRQVTRMSIGQYPYPGLSEKLLGDLRIATQPWFDNQAQNYTSNYILPYFLEN